MISQDTTQLLGQVTCLEKNINKYISEKNINKLTKQGLVAKQIVNEKLSEDLMRSFACG